MNDLPLEFLLSAVSGRDVPKMYAVMLEPGSYRVVLLANAERPEFTAFQHKKAVSPDDEVFTTEMYSMHHADNNPRCLISNKFGGSRAKTAQAALDLFKPKDYPLIVIKGFFPLPVMFYIGDADERSNRGGLTVQLVTEK